MLSDLDLANLCLACYTAPEVFDSFIDIDGVYVGVKHYDDCSAVSFRGSTTPLDWFRDFEGLMIQDPTIGAVEDGFMCGIKDVWDFLGAELDPKKKLYVTGHSLGGARALLFAGLDYVFTSAPTEIVVFGSPRPGGNKLKEVLASVAIRSYRNGLDPVCEVPMSIPFIEPYVHPRDLISVSIPPSSDDEWGDLMGYHHIEKYIEAMEGMKNG